MMLKDRHVLITGGTGSFGKKCTEILLNEFPPKRLVIFSRDEQKHVDMARNGFSPAKFPQIRYFVGDVRDEARLRRAMRGIDFVIHAAAMKHVDIAEYNPQECIRTNIGGAENVINAAIDSGVEKVVALSTDKAAASQSLRCYQIVLRQTVCRSKCDFRRSNPIRGRSLRKRSRFKWFGYSVLSKATSYR